MAKSSGAAAGEEGDRRRGQAARAAALQDHAAPTSSAGDRLRLQAARAVEPPASAATHAGAGDRLPFELVTPHGTVRGALPLPGRPVHLSEAVVPLFGVDSAIVDQAVRHAAATGQPSRCGPGCGACCRQLVPLAVPEAFALTATLRDLPPAQRHLLRHRFAHLGATLARHPDLRHRLFAIDADPAATTATALAYFDLAIACPFLERDGDPPARAATGGQPLPRSLAGGGAPPPGSNDPRWDDPRRPVLLAEGSCSIHPARPSICREFHVASDPAWCATPAAAKAVAIPTPLRLSELLAHAHAYLYRLDRPLLIPLALAPSWTADHPELDHLAWPAAPLLRDLLGAMARAMAEGGPRAATAFNPDGAP